MSNREDEDLPKHNNFKIAKTSSGSPQKEPAWRDDDDEIGDEEGLRNRKGFKNVRGNNGTMYRTRLEESFQLVHGPTPPWATGSKPKGEESDEDDAEVEQIFNQSKQSVKSLPRNELSILRVLDLNNEVHERDVIRSVEFHPKVQVGLVAGSNRQVSLFTVDGSKNTMVQTARFGGSGVDFATFSADGKEFYVLSGNDNYFWTYDIVSGKISKAIPSFLSRSQTIHKIIPSPDNRTLVTLGRHGDIHLYSKESKEIIGSLHANADVTDAGFNASGSILFASTASGEIYQYDTERRLCEVKVADEGSILTSKIAVSQNHIACGSTSGVVNVYSVDNLGLSKLTGYPKPIKSFMNLTTKITSLKFDSTGDLLAMASMENENAIRLAHVPSMTVYSNFPYVNAFWKRPNTVAFSPNTGYFALGNNAGSAYLFRIKHFDKY